MGEKPLFDGLCAMCASLLFGDVAGGALSNKAAGPPCNREGQAVDDVKAQPPCFLRYSPAFFAKEAPAIFEHDPATNRLSLKPGAREPWLRPRRGGSPTEWLYCAECQARWFPAPGQRGHSHVPFRDRASQPLMKKVERTYKPTGHEPKVQDGAEDPSPCELPEDPAPMEEEEEVEEAMNPYFPAPRPSLEEYRTKWAHEEARHARAVPGAFSRDNLVPAPVPLLWQDCPFVPFSDLKSDEAQARLAVVKPISGLEPASVADGVPRYAHNTGDVCFRRRNVLQLASTFGFVIGKRSGEHMHLRPSEEAAVHECLTWARQGNNAVLTFFGSVFECFTAACGKLASKFKSVLPEGSTRARIRATKRIHENLQSCETNLGSTLGEETVGMVVVDLTGVPLKYDKLTVFSDVVATQATRLEIDVPGEGGRGWRRSGSSVHVDDDLNEAWRKDVRAGVQHLLTETWVPANDPHFDAKAWPIAHPYGTGSLLSEVGSGGTQRHARARLSALDSFFRRSALWGFWFLDRLIKTELFFKEKRRRQAGRPSAAADEPDALKKLFGVAQPADIPESTAWWQRQQRDLLAMCAEEELGLMHTMVTITANDSSSEMLAAVRRGPFAEPTPDEHLEYLLSTKAPWKERPRFEDFSLEHVLSFQRRVHAVKTQFFRRDAKTPLGRLREWWDRTEAQMRAALHAHILVWFRRRDLKARDERLRAEGKVYEPLKPVPRTAPGTGGPRQRPAAQVVEPLAEPQEFDGYHAAEQGRVVAEMCRPDVSGVGCGGYSCEQLRVAGLARAVQSRLYLHSCTARYCLQNRATCRFMFPWPRQPYQCYDENAERVALRRRLPEDDQWLVPHELYLAMFSPATVNVLPFDPRHGADQARQYAAKYASKAEKWYYMETEKNGVKDFLKCRTVGLCMSHNRLMNYHVVRSTRPVQFIPGEFLPAAALRSRREDGHLQKFPSFPDPECYLSYFQRYLFRPPELLHLRVEQLNRYFAATDGRAAATLEDTLSDDEPPPPEEAHRHYDEVAEGIAPGTVFESAFQGVSGWRRRQSERLGVGRTAQMEPVGERREPFFEQRLALTFPWRCERPQPLEGGGCRWRVTWTPPPPRALGGAVLPEQELVLEPGAAVSFEQTARNLETELCLPEHDLVCRCCLGESVSGCQSCRYAVGLHRCEDCPGLRWRKGCLFAGSLDLQRVLWNLHRKGLPMQVLRDKAALYENTKLLSSDHSKAVIAAIEQERNVQRLFQDPDGLPPEAAAAAEQEGRLNREQLLEELRRREANMQTGGSADAPTDQWRVYTHIVRALQEGPFLRLLVQASAGTGKSYLLTTVYLWCLSNGKRCKAAAPTGIAAANVAVTGCDVRASTLHNVFDFDGDMRTSLDFSKLTHPKVAELMAMEAFLVDEFSMLDTACWSSVEEVLSIIDHSKRPAAKDDSSFGDLHVVLFGDFKQLPPATSRGPFIILPSVYESFDFLVLRQNRRVTSDPARALELEAFHAVLSDVSEGRPTEAVKRFLVEAYVRGALDGCAEKAAVEGTTAIFTKRRFRDAWNRTVVRRIGRVHNHFLKIRARVRARGARGQNWLSEARTEQLRRQARTQALWNLTLAGDFHEALEVKPLSPKPHLMRVMLISNVAVDQRFANGTQGRLLSWTPASVQNKKALSAGHPELTARFAKESAMGAPSMVPEIHFMDLAVRSETLHVRGEPVLIQLPLVPAYALTTHKTQALSIPHRVFGSLEGVFATGQTYVLISRVTDPANFNLVGVPPSDLVDDVYAAVGAAGLDAEAWLQRAVRVTGEWVLGAGATPRARLVPQFVSANLAPVRLRSLSEVLDPQPEAKAIYSQLLAWIDRADLAAQRGEPRPVFATASGDDIFPEEAWWLTVHQRKAMENEKEPCAEPPADEDGPPSEVSEAPDHLAEDSDPMSDGSGFEEDRAGLGRAPHVAWRRGPPPPPAPQPPPPPPPPSVYRCYFEKQREARCGLHALNNALGRPFATEADLEAAVGEVLRDLRQDGVPEVRAQHIRPGGWYSIEALCMAIPQVSMATAGRVEYTLSLEPLCVHAAALRTAVGAVANVEGRHWVALRWVDDAVWLLDSMDQPRELSWSAYLHFVRRHRDSFRIDYA